MQAPKETMPELAVSETGTSTWNYHLRFVGKDGLRLGGKAGDAICGKSLGWDTKIPTSAWGTKDGYSVWCKKCEEMARDLGYKLPRRRA